MSVLLDDRGLPDGVDDLGYPVAEKPHPDALFDLMWRSRHNPKPMDGWVFVYRCAGGCPDAIGAKMLRVDVPVQGDFDKGYVSHFYGGGSIFSLTPCDLAAVRRAGESYTPPALAWQGNGRDDNDDGGGAGPDRLDGS